jgi:hypothetical protein
MQTMTMIIDIATDTLVKQIVTELKYENIAFDISENVVEMIAFDQVRQHTDKPLCDLVEQTKTSIIACLYDDNIH